MNGCKLTICIDSVPSLWLTEIQREDQAFQVMVPLSGMGKGKPQVKGDAGNADTLQPFTLGEKWQIWTGQKCQNKNASLSVSDVQLATNLTAKLRYVLIP